MCVKLTAAAVRSASAAERTFATRGIFAASGFTADSWSFAAAVRKSAAATVAVLSTAKRRTSADASATAAAGAVTAPTAAALIAAAATSTIMFTCIAHYTLNAENNLLNSEK